MYLKQIINILEEQYPKNLAYDWDNVGLLVGNINSDIKNIMLCLEANESIIDEAIQNKVDLIITHHPFIFKKLTSINENDIKGKCIYKLIKNNINIYCMHTNFDIAFGGLNDAFAQMLNLQNINILENAKNETLYKIAVYVPLSHEEVVREAMTNSDAGNIGNYRDCTFNTKGTGTFRPSQESNPFIGRSEILERVEEVKIESVCEQRNLNKIINNMIKAHPYEEVAYDIYKLENKGKSYGLGRYGSLEWGMTLEELSNKIKIGLNSKHLRIVGKSDKIVKKIAIVTGSGGDFVKKSYLRGCDVLVTGDVKYHEAQDAIDLGIAIIDAGHFETENIFIDIVHNYLSQRLSDVNIIKSSININPFSII
ncbi:MAG TPA: Nif3-like dinuclear metal center hexameric protein [Peptostreptococcaceae bacterium]|nr:Nif3-like dinuclear metal center hexameric protein [Peptostreptococcaceae bacterium]